MQCKREREREKSEKERKKKEERGGVTNCLRVFSTTCAISLQIYNLVTYHFLFEYEYEFLPHKFFSLVYIFERKGAGLSCRFLNRCTNGKEDF